MKGNEQPYIKLENIGKTFGVTQALENINLNIFRGEVLGLIGPNGAGKSTLIKIITGVLQPTSGKIYVNNEEMLNYGVSESQDNGIACAYQDLSLCTNLTVFENFALLESSKDIFSIGSWRKPAIEKTEALLEKFFPDNGINVFNNVEDLTLAERQIVEITKTLMTDNLKVLILDEPTASLSHERAEQLHEVIRELKSKNVAVIYISHKLNEIRKITDRIVLLKNGKNNGIVSSDEVTQEELVGLMGGLTSRSKMSKGTYEKTEPIIKIKQYSDDKLHDINFTLNKGEILGITGLGGSGQRELLELLFKNKNLTDHIQIDGSVAYISGDRANEGIFPLWDISENIVISSLKKIKNGVLISRKKENDLAQHWYDKLKFRAEGLRSPITSLSGGNQQKAIIARGIACGADIIILNDPTAGVDIETKNEIYSLLQDVKQQGKSIIFHSTEDVEMEICDRAYVMTHGTISSELMKENLTVSNIIEASFKNTSSEEKDNQILEKKHMKPKVSFRKMIPLLAMIIMIISNVVLNPNLLSYFGFETILGSALPLIFAALGQMFLVVSSDVDMGNGYSIGLANVIIAVIGTRSPLLGILSIICLLCAYLLMALLIQKCQMPSIVVTLAAQFIWLGAALIISPSPGGSSPEWLSFIYKFKLPFIPMPVVWAAIIALLSWLILYRFKYGLVIKGIGNNSLAVERSGWSLTIAKMVSYGISAIFIMLAGLALTAVSMGSDPNIATSYTMLSIATVILGGCEMSGGFVEPIGVVFGAITMSYITTLLTSLKIDSNLQTAIIGIILLVVLGFKTIYRQRSK